MMVLTMTDFCQFNNFSSGDLIKLTWKTDLGQFPTFKMKELCKIKLITCQTINCKPLNY